MKRQKRKLKLVTNTVRNLNAKPIEDTELRGVAGGNSGALPTLCEPGVTHSCNGQCGL